MNQARIDEINSARGFIKPIYHGSFHADGTPEYGLGPEDFEKVRRGYACPRCLADFGGIYRVVCPVCHHERDVVADFMDEPDYWKPDPNDPDRN